MSSAASGAAGYTKVVTSVVGRVGPIKSEHLGYGLLFTIVACIPTSAMVMQKDQRVCFCGIALLTLVLLFGMFVCVVHLFCRIEGLPVNRTQEDAMRGARRARAVHDREKQLEADPPQQE